MKTVAMLGFVVSMLVQSLGSEANQESVDNPYGIIMAWDRASHYANGKRLSAEQVSTVVYVLYAAYAEDNYKTWHEVVRTKYPEYQFDGPEPFCVRTMVRNYFPEEDSYSDPSDSTITCIDENHEVTWADYDD